MQARNSGRALVVRQLRAFQSAPTGKPEDARITSIVVNGRPVGEEILSWEYGSWSFKRYMLDWTGRTNLKTFEISDGKIILETNGSEQTL